MPTSHYTQIPAIIAAVIEIAPKSIFEVGVGCGKWGALLREYLTVWDHYLEPFDMRSVTIHGIEVHPLYSASPAWACYERVIVGDARDYKLPQDYDMGLLVDVLEHFDIVEGCELLRYLLERCSCVLVAVPNGFFETIEVWENPHEIHRGAYDADLLRGYGFQVEVKHESDSLVMVVRN